MNHAIALMDYGRRRSFFLTQLCYMHWTT